MKQFFLCLLFLFLATNNVFAQEQTALQKGWHYLIQDDDTLAMHFFHQALNEAIDSKNELDQANAFLYLGFASYGSSLHQGLHFAQEALLRFDKLHSSYGRARVLQLLATIKTREGNIKEAEQLAQQALANLPSKQDTTFTRGLALNLLGFLKEKQQQSDSSDFYYQEAFRFRLKEKDSLYLGASCIQMGKLADKRKQYTLADSFFYRALFLAQQVSNKQAQVNALLALATHFSGRSEVQADRSYLQQAKLIAQTLNDKSFLLRCLTMEKEMLEHEQQYKEAFLINETTLQLKDSMKNLEEERLTRMLTIQYDVQETERKLLLIQKEHHITKLTNYILLGSVVFVLILSLVGFFVYRKHHKQQQALIETQQALLQAGEEQKKLREQTLQNEIEFKESQLSAITIQMLQKNQLLEEIQDKLETKEGDLGLGIRKVIHKNQVQEQEWEDFEKSFERVNRNFYTRIKQQYPDISANELKICALIKMNLSTKEMAGIMAITPESVKTARYRLRKKLQLQTEDNLNSFIMNL